MGGLSGLRSQAQPGVARPSLPSRCLLHRDWGWGSLMDQRAWLAGGNPSTDLGLTGGDGVWGCSPASPHSPRKFLEPSRAKHGGVCPLPPR